MLVDRVSHDVLGPAGIRLSTDVADLSSQHHLSQLPSRLLQFVQASGQDEIGRNYAEVSLKVLSLVAEPTLRA